MTYLLAILISLAQGYFLLRLLLPLSRPRLAWMLVAGLLVGFGISAEIAFMSLLLFNQLVIPFVIMTNTALAILLGILAARKSSSQDLFPIKEFDKTDGCALLALVLLTVPAIIHASIYPYGGWDAWSCWNLKAQMIYTGGEAWRNMFDPILWRSNTAYPLLLPLINTWLWCFGSSPEPSVPLAVSCLITFLVAGLLFFSLKELTQRLWAILAPAWLLSIVFIVKLASSQYSDLLVGTFFLLALAAFFLYEQRRKIGFLHLALIALGLMSFTKSEGLVLSLIALTGMTLVIAVRKETRSATAPAIRGFIITALLAFLVSAVFQIFFAPQSTTFINGLTSAEKATSLERLWAVAVFFGMEMISPKWNGLWLLSATGLLLGWKKSLTGRRWIIPAIIAGYLAVICGVYWINTFFEIIWWLGTTLNRILFALTPSIIFWLFLSILS